MAPSRLKEKAFGLALYTHWNEVPARVLRVENGQLVAFESLDCSTVEQAFSEMCRRQEEGPDRARWRRVMNVTTQSGGEVVNLVVAMAEVEQLGSNPKSGVGSVVLKRRPQAA